VRRAAILLGGLFILCAAGFAWLVRDDSPALAPAGQPASTGSAPFERYCASCHAAEDLRQQLKRDGTQARDRFETFLSDHGEASAAEDRLILDYLTGREAP
jgi:mono/diheme cytochrome c family protein